MSIQQVAPPPEHDPLKRHLVETSFESCTKFKEILDSTPIYNFINISIKPLDSKSEQIKRFKENVFVIDLDVIDSHFHFLNDVIGQFLLLKEHIPDIFPVILIRSPISVKRARSKIPNSKSRLSNFIYDLLSKIKDLNVEITDINNYKEVIIENSFAISTETSQYTIKSELFGLAGHSPELTVPLIQRALGLDFKAVPKNKIFITRMHENNKTRRMKKTLEYWSLKDLKEKEKYKNKIGYSNYEKIVSRFISLQEEIDLENFFKNMGYIIINPSLYSAEKQIEIFSMASHVAGLAGAGFINTIYCKPGAIVTILKTNTDYEFTHGDWARAAGHSLIEIPEVVKQEAIMLTGQDLINILKTVDGL
jgi:hypothetical protein